MAIIILLVLLYVLGIRKTIESIGDYYKIENQELDEIKVYSKNKDLNRQYNELSAIISDKNESQISSSLLIFINSNIEANSLRLHKFIDPQLLETDFYKVYQTEFILTGNFKDCLLFIDKLEKKSEIGKIISVRFKKGNSFDSNKLFASIICQNLSSK
ncbi:MAG: hypothetical protein RH860_01810 [Cytophagales bacterium]